jgi:hypothetical protein
MSRGIAPPYLTLAIDGGEWSASLSGFFTPRERGRPIPTGYEAGWTQDPVRTLCKKEKFLPHAGNRNLARPSSQHLSQYRLSYCRFYTCTHGHGHTRGLHFCCCAIPRTYRCLKQHALKAATIKWKAKKRNFDCDDTFKVNVMSVARWEEGDWFRMSWIYIYLFMYTLFTYDTVSCSDCTAAKCDIMLQWYEWKLYV